MKIRYTIAVLAIVLMTTAATAAGPPAKSTADDQTGMEVTVYNSNIGLIKDTRNIVLPKGQGELRFMDVAASIKPVTVLVKAANAPETFSILEQNYEYDLMNASKLLDKYVGKKIKIIDWNKYQDRTETVEAILLSNNQDQILKIGNEIYLGYPGVKVLPELPENLIAKPTLTWLYENERAGPLALEVSYLTDNITWKADYVMVLNAKDTSSDLAGWVTVDNRSGGAYRDATLKLVAGEFHRVEDRYREKMFAMEDKARVGAAQFVEKEFFEYHIYDLARKTTLKDMQTKQVTLLEAPGVGVRKEYRVYGSSSFFTQRLQDETPKQPVKVMILFRNAADNGLGMPLPAGIIRLYKEDESGSRQFAGEDEIAHTPKNEEVALTIGEAFDIAAERIQTNFVQITTRRYESEWEITLRNHKKEAVTVAVIEPLWGSWNIMRSSHPYKKLDAFTVRFDVKVPVDGETKVTYKVSVGL